jgi:hypothetical protein
VVLPVPFGSSVAPCKQNAENTARLSKAYNSGATGALSLFVEQQELCPYSRVLNCALHLHQALGPGLLESVYEVTLARKLRQQGLRVERQMPMPIEYEGGAL